MVEWWGRESKAELNDIGRRRNGDAATKAEVRSKDAGYEMQYRGRNPG